MTLKSTPPVSSNRVAVGDVSREQFHDLASEAEARGIYTMQVVQEGAVVGTPVLDSQRTGELDDLLVSARAVLYDVRGRTVIFDGAPLDDE